MKKMEFQLNRKALSVTAAILFVLFTVNTTATVIYSRSAETTAEKVRDDLDALRITTQNKCIVRMVLSYPPPVPAEEFPVILKEYDACIAKQAEEIQKSADNRSRP